jgi:hypothetical protein
MIMIQVVPLRLLAALFAVNLAEITLLFTAFFADIILRLSLM